MHIKVTYTRFIRNDTNNARQFIIEFTDKGWTKNNISSLQVKLRKFETVRSECIILKCVQIMCANILKYYELRYMLMFKKVHLVKVGAFA